MATVTFRGTPRRTVKMNRTRLTGITGSDTGPRLSHVETSGRRGCLNRASRLERIPSWAGAAIDPTHRGSRMSGIVERDGPRRQAGRWATAGAVLGCALTACSSGPPPNPSPTSSQAGQYRSTDAPALLVQCMLTQGPLGLTDSI